MLPNDVDREDVAPFYSCENMGLKLSEMLSVAFEQNGIEDDDITEDVPSGSCIPIPDAVVQVMERYRRERHAEPAARGYAPETHPIAFK